MAKEAVVGVLRAILEADTAQFDAGMKRSAQKVVAFGEETTKAAANIAEALSGKRIVKQAQDTVEALRLIQGATNLTAKEAGRLVPMFTEALAKLKAMGLEGTPEAAKLRTALAEVTAQAGTATTAIPSMTARVKEMALGYAAGALSVQAFIGAGRQVIKFISDSVGEYLEAEKGQRALTAALSAAGFAIPSVLTYFEALSKKYAELTVFTDDAITETQTLLVQLGGVLPSEMDKALSAVTELATFMGGDLRGAAMMVGKAFEDNFGALKKMGIDIDEARAKAEGMDYVLGEIQAKFKGSAGAELESYSGKVKQLEKEFADLQEEIGQTVVESGGAEILFLALSIIMRQLAADVALVAAGLKAMPDFTKFDNPTAFLLAWGIGTRVELEKTAAAVAKLKKAATPGSAEHTAMLADIKLKEDAAKAATALEKANEAGRKKREAAAKEHEAELKRLAEKQKEYELTMTTGLSPAMREQLRLHDAWVERTTRGVRAVAIAIQSNEEFMRSLKAVNLVLATPPPKSGIAMGDPTGRAAMGTPITLDLEGERRKALEHTRKINEQQQRHNILLGIGSRLAHELFANFDPAVGKLLAQGLDLATEALGRFIDNMSQAGSRGGMIELGISAIVTSITEVIRIGREAREAGRIGEETRQQFIRDIQELGYTWEQYDAMVKAMFLAGDRPAQGQSWYEYFLETIEEAAQQATDAIEDLGAEVNAFGGRAPAALQPLITSLLTSSRLSEAQRDMLRDLQGEDDLDYLRNEAAAFGIAESALGVGFHQQDVNQQANRIFMFLNRTRELGSDAAEVLAGLADEAQALLKKSWEEGTALPEYLRESLEEMIKLGLLTDEAGNKLENLDGFRFDESIASSVDRMTEAIERLIEAIGGLPAVAEKVSTVGNSFRTGSLVGSSSGGFVGFPGGDKGTGMPTPSIDMSRLSADDPRWVNWNTAQAAAGSGTMTVIVEADGRTLSRIVTPYLPGEVKRLGLAHG